MAEVEIREPGRPPRRVTVDGSVEIGRECDGELVDDTQVSRRHLRISAKEGRLLAVDLGSSNGTTLDGAPLTAGVEVELSEGAVLVLGRTEVAVSSAVTPPPEPAQEPAQEPAPPPGDGSSAAAAPTPQPAATTPQSAATTPQPAAPAPPLRPAVAELASIENDAAVVRFRRGSAGEAAAVEMAAKLRRARQRLSGLGSEPWGARPQVCLVDPFPDPDHPGEVVASGTVVDAAASEIWMVTTAESPPEPPERPLALIFGAALPAAEDLGVVLEGYGLFLAKTPDQDGELRDLDLPSLASADGELRPAMARSFVAFLIEREGEPTLRRLLAEARPHQVEAAFQDTYGAATGALEDMWRKRLHKEPPSAKTGQLLRLSVRYLRPHVRREAEGFVYMLLGLAFSVVFPFAFRQLLDHDIRPGGFPHVLDLLGVLAIAFVVSLLASLRQAYLSSYVSASVVRQLRMEMFGKLQDLSAGWFASREQGDVLSRLFSDVGALEQGISRTLRTGIYQLLSLVVSAVVLLVLDPLLGVIVVAGAPLIALVYKTMGSGARRRSLAVQEETGAVLALAAENYGAQQIVKAFALEAREKLRFGRASDRLFRTQLRLQLFSGLFGVSVNMVVTVLRLVVLGLGAWLILRGHLTVGGLVAFMSVMGQVLSPVAELTGIGRQLQASSGALVRVDEVLGAVAGVPDTGTGELAPLAREIHLDHIAFGYTSERRTLEGIDAHIPAGARVAFVGPTGAGKSSILQLLMRFYDPDEGRVLFDETDVRTCALASLRSQLGVVFQETFLYDTTVRENIALGRPGATDDEVEAAARAAELHDFVVSLPRGYNTLVGERGGHLSGGQRQRLAIARALLRAPTVLVLDEATSALDPRTERLISATLERLGEGRTTVAVTHRLTSITAYDRIFVIVDGHLAEQGTHTELLSLGGVYAQLWAEQTGGHVPSEPPFDAAAALARVALFADLDRSALRDAAGRMRPVDLAAGESLPEGGGRLLLVRRGRGRVLAPGIGGALGRTAELGPGQLFGLAALLGQETGSVLEAVEPLSLLVLEDDAISALAALHPQVADALSASARVLAGPEPGRHLTRLVRLTIGPYPGAGPGGPSLGGSLPAGSASSALAPQAAPSAEDVSRATGSYGAVGR